MFLWMYFAIRFWCWGISFHSQTPSLLNGALENVEERIFHRVYNLSAGFYSVSYYLALYCCNFLSVLINMFCYLFIKICVSEMKTVESCLWSVWHLHDRWRNGINIFLVVSFLPRLFAKRWRFTECNWVSIMGRPYQDVPWKFMPLMNEGSDHSETC